MSQQDLEGNDALKSVSLEESTTTTYTVTSEHFFLRATDAFLEKVHGMDAPAKQHDALAKKVKAKPYVEDIPRGAKGPEAEQLVAAILGM